MKHLKEQDKFEFQGGLRDLLDTFPAPAGTNTITLICTEVTSLCPITHQPDYHTIIITYIPDRLCVESKSLKMYLNTYRQEGIMTEPLSHRILLHLMQVLTPVNISVKVKSASRGGISVEATCGF